MSQYTEGTILHTQTSYEMTFNHYYQIVKVKGQSIVVRPLAKHQDHGRRLERHGAHRQGRLRGR